MRLSLKQEELFLAFILLRILNQHFGILFIFFFFFSYFFSDHVQANIDDTSQYKSLTYASRATEGVHNWIIGVYGSPLMSSRVSHPLPYKLLVWEPDF